ncbi:exosome complex component RRP45 [Bacillus rossius redtenbacheri]|uniref:exosome complex component RRP45 n=1 Tax=Bacillus rossius redtenbacheri TaxID=93214 RepID=UPI002FDEDD57
MRETLLSTCEKSFILKALSEGRRLDGRRLDDFRDVKISFGSDWGCCQVSLRETKVLAQVSCDVAAPKATRPNEGLVHLNVELSPMGAPHFETGRLSELGVQLNRLLEKCLKDSKCVDLESLCIVAEEKVWNLRVDIHVLNHEGGLVDAASIAALAALNHFRRPDVTMDGEQVVIHDPSERDPLPLTLHHQPVCITYALFDNLEEVVADPTQLEERVSQAQVVLGMNSYRELCGVHLGGSALASDSTVWQCSVKAASRAAHVVASLKEALARDLRLRARGELAGLAECVRQPSLLSLTQDRLSLCLDRELLRRKASGMTSRQVPDTERDEPVVVALGGASAELLPASLAAASVGDGGRSKWETRSGASDGAEEEEVKFRAPSHVDPDLDDSGSDPDPGSGSGEDEGSDDVEVIREVSFQEKLQQVENIDLLDSDEEETAVVTSSFSGAKEQSPRKKKQAPKQKEVAEKSRSWYPQQSPW